MLDELDDDPIFVRVRSARPVPPATLTAAVLAGLPVRHRSLTLPVAMSGVVAVMVLVVLVGSYLRRVDDGIPHGPPRIGVAAIERPDAAVDASSQRVEPDWTDLRALLVELHATYGDDLRRCAARGRTRVDIRVAQRWLDDGSRTTVPSYALRFGLTPQPTRDREEACIADVVKQMVVPPLPSSVVAIEFDIVLAPGGMTKAPRYGQWNDLSRAGEAMLADHDADLRRCLKADITSADIPAGVWTQSTDMTSPRAARLYLGGVKDRDCATCGPPKLPYDPACIERVSRTIERMHLPWPVIRIDFVHHVNAA